MGRSVTVRNRKGTKILGSVSRDFRWDSRERRREFRRCEIASDFFPRPDGG